jgi:hypothetical protein
MANRYFKQFVLTPVNRQVHLAGIISLSNSAAVTASNIPLASVAKSGTGEYTITLQDPYVELRSLNVSALSTQDITVRIKSHNVSSARTLVIETLVAGVVADVSAAAELHVSIILKDSSVGV